MAILRLHPAIDQTELGEIAALDPSTTGDVMARLERRGLVQRHDQGQCRVCDLTTHGALLLDQVTPHVAAAQRQLVDALTQIERILRRYVTDVYHTDPPSALGRFDPQRLRTVQDFYFKNRIIQTRVPIEDLYTNAFVS